MSASFDNPDVDSEGRVPVRIQRVIARLNVGGPALHVVWLAEGLDADSSFESTLLVGQLGPGEGDMTYVADDSGVSVTRVPGLGPTIHPFGDLKAVWWLYRRFRRDRPHIVHTHTAKAGAVGRLAATLARVPVRIHTYHGHVLGGDYFSASATALFRFVEQVLSRVTHRLVAISPRQTAELGERLGISRVKHLRCIPLGLKLDGFSTVDRGAARSRVRRAIGVPEDGWIVVTAGRVVPVKNHSLLLKAFAQAVERLAEDRDSARLVIVGDGESALRAELEHQAAVLGIGEQVRWLGWRRDLPDILAGADVFALTSHDEGTPVAVIEAICAGTTVVARSVGGVSDVINEVPFAQAVHSDQPTAFADALLDSRTVQIAPAEAARIRAHTARRFSSARLVEDIKALYLDALEEAGISAGA